MAGLDAVTHYCRYGWREGRRPNPYFDPAWYVQRYRDVQESGAEPLLHYIECGEAEGRLPIAHFDPAWYRAHHRVPTGQGALQHFLRHRRGGSVSPVPEFDAAYYCRLAPDVAAAGMDPFEHYLVQGAAEGRPASAGFDTAWYRQRYLRGQPGVNPLLHFRQHRYEPGVLPCRPAGHDTDIPREVRRNTARRDRCSRRRRRCRRVRRGARRCWRSTCRSSTRRRRTTRGGATASRNGPTCGARLPRFAGHYQPRIPRDLGHYRLDDGRGDPGAGGAGAGRRAGRVRVLLLLVQRPAAAGRAAGCDAGRPRHRDAVLPDVGERELDPALGRGGPARC